MKASFKVYGYAKQNSNSQLIELSTVSLCFSDRTEVVKFLKFIENCTVEMETNAQWNHEHFGPNSEGEPDVILAILDPKNC